jgi:TetR/AcrR family transcriptional regulator, regulator of cefoperazone and chloramphenicol sensitivity
MTDPHTQPDARERLIQAGIEIFAEYGFNATTTRMLADKAKVNLSAIPYYFRSKEGLYNATVGHIADVLAAHLEPFLEQLQTEAANGFDPATARVLLQEGLSTMVAVMCGDPGTMRFSQIILREQMAPTAAFDLIYPKVMERILAAFATLIATITGETDTRQCSLQAILLIGQVMVFRAGRATVVRRIGMEGYTAREISEIQELVVSRAMAALDFMAARQA